MRKVTSIKDERYTSCDGLDAATRRPRKVAPSDFAQGLRWVDNQKLKNRRKGMIY